MSNQNNQSENSYHCPNCKHNFDQPSVTMSSIVGELIFRNLRCPNCKLGVSHTSNKTVYEMFAKLFRKED